jgi:DNA-binding NtrC family response regulator
VVDGLVIRSRGATVDLADLGRSLGSAPQASQEGAAAELPDPASAAFPGMKDVLEQQARSLKRRLILAALERSGGNKSEAARLLQVDYKTLYNLAKELDISAKVSFEGQEQA